VKLQGIIATTHIDRQNDRIAKEALESMASQIYNEHKIRLTVEHDITVPPIGKTLEGWVEARNDGEYQLVAIHEVFEKEEEIELFDGSLALKRESLRDRHPFAGIEDQPPEDIVISYDLHMFSSKEDQSNFLENITNSSNLAFQVSEFGRKSWVPDPELIITVGKSIAGFWLVKKAIDKAGDKIGEQISEDLSQFYSLVRSAVINVVKYAIPKNRPITYIFKIPGTPHIEFVIRTTDSNLVLSSILLEKQKEALEQAEQLHKTLQAEYVQFLLDNNGMWKFNYLLTNQGDVIGKKERFLKNPREFQLTSSDQKNIITRAKKRRKNSSRP
jgi:hypothetical protein